MMMEPNKKPNNGDMKIKRIVLKIPDHTKALNPAFGMHAPIKPPMSACDELDGIP
jgi:hypothetical protein